MVRALNVKAWSGASATLRPMNARLLALALVVSLGACAAEKDDPATGPAPDGTYRLASWKADASGVDCVGADHRTTATLMRDVDGDPLTPDVLENEIVCTWWCARYEGEPPITPVAWRDGEPVSVAAHFAVRPSTAGNVWTPVLFYTWLPQCLQ
jgi:hypothetical protein